MTLLGAEVLQQPLAENRSPMRSMTLRIAARTARPEAFGQRQVEGDLELGDQLGAARRVGREWRTSPRRRPAPLSPAGGSWRNSIRSGSVKTIRSVNAGATLRPSTLSPRHLPAPVVAVGGDPLEERREPAPSAPGRPGRPRSQWWWDDGDGAARGGGAAGSVPLLDLPRVARRRRVHDAVRRQWRRPAPCASRAS